MKHHSSHKSTLRNAPGTSNYTRSKDAYDGNMEITNLKSSSLKIVGSIESPSNSTRPEKENSGKV